MLKTCAGVVSTMGRRAHGSVVEPLSGNTSIPLPTLIECNQMPDNRDEIPTPEAAYYHDHMRAIADEIPAIDPSADILLLLGWDILRVHKVWQQCNGPHDAPFTQKLDLGWVIVGNVCLSGAHTPKAVTTFKTCYLDNGHPSHLLPCDNVVRVKEIQSSVCEDISHSYSPQGNHLGETIFQRTEKDYHLAPSVEDRTFLQLMDKEFHRDDTCSWVAPLPFRQRRKRLLNNLQYEFQRLMSLRRNFERKPTMKDDFLEFVQGILDNHHAELAPPLEEGKEDLPLFGVYHPQKPGKIRVVFDSSARFEGVSLNNVMLPGPNLNNSLLAVLIRFRKEPVAVTADIL